MGDKPVVLDREFSYLELLRYRVQVSVSFVSRLNRGSYSATFYDGAQGATNRQSERTGGLRVLRHMDKMTVDVIRVWRKGGVGSL